MGLREIAFVGGSNTGKTTLIEGVLARLGEAGVRVAVVKHTHHQVEWDTPGKDSYRFREAGANPIVLRTPRWDLIQSRGSGTDEGIRRVLAQAQLVIHEGARRSQSPKVLVGESIDEARRKGTAGEIIAVVGTEHGGAVPTFSRGDVEGVARFLLGRLELPPGEASFAQLLDRSVAAHGHLCPGQVLGVRMAIRGLHELGLRAPPPAKRVVVMVETDRCAADAVGSVTGCSLGKRTLKYFDYGKMAATFLDLHTAAAVRVVARDDSRERVPAYAPDIEDSHEAQTAAYRLMPDAELMTVEPVRVLLSEADMPGRPSVRVPCSQCGEHVSGDRRVTVEGRELCRACAGGAYYEKY